MTPEQEHALYSRVGARMRAARRACGMNQETLAGVVGVVRTSITNAETGRQRTPLHTIVAIAEALGEDPALWIADKPYTPRGAALDIDTYNALTTHTEALRAIVRGLGVGVSE